MRRHLSLLAATMLGACVGRPQPLALAPAPVVAPVAEAPPAPTPINAGLSPAATLWHLRAGLNVAALACRTQDLAPGYNALLAREAASLRAAEAAYAAEFQAQGGAWRQRYDDEMTRLYNFWGGAQGRDGLCATAAAALADPAVATDAGAQLAALDRAFAPPRLEVDPAVFGGPPVQVAVR